jgi:hypothetical protein
LRLALYLHRKQWQELVLDDAGGGLPANLPHTIEVDISNLAMDEHISLTGLVMPKCTKVRYTLLLLAFGIEVLILSVKSSSSNKIKIQTLKLPLN